MKQAETGLSGSVSKRLFFISSSFCRPAEFKIFFSDRRLIETQNLKKLKSVWNNNSRRRDKETENQTIKTSKFNLTIFRRNEIMRTIRLFLGLMMMAGLLFGMNAATFAKPKKKQAKFKVRIENISSGEQVNASGTKYPFALSPGMYVVSEKEMPLFKVGKKAALGIEMQAEDGNPMLLVDSLSGKVGNAYLGVFNTPVGANMPAPILPGGAFEFEVDAVEGQKLTLTTMYGQSNDLFYAPSKAIELFENGEPLNGDITEKMMLWDAGTEVNEEPGTGANQAPRQKMANMGMIEKGVVKLVVDSFNYPQTKSVLRVTVTPVN